MRIFDNGGKSIDRYRVTWSDEFPEEAEMDLYVGETGNVPNGFCQHGEGYGDQPLEGETEISPADLPEPARRAIDLADLDIDGNLN